MNVTQPEQQAATADENKTREVLKEGATLRFANLHRGFYAAGFDLWFPCVVVWKLIRNKNAKRNGDGSIVSYSKAEYDFDAKEAQKAGQARKFARLDRWRAELEACTHFRHDSTNPFITHLLNAALEKIANEAMTLGSLSD